MYTYYIAVSLSLSMNYIILGPALAFLLAISVGRDGEMIFWLAARG